MYIQFWLEQLKGRDYLGDLDTDRKNIKLDLKEIRVHWIYMTKNSSVQGSCENNNDLHIV